MRRVLSVLITLTALLAVAATPALGHEGEFQPHRFSLRQVGLSADAFWQTCQADTPEPGLTTCRQVSLFGFEGRVVIREAGMPPVRQAGQACVSLTVTEEEFGPPVSEEFGCTETFAFDAADDLSSATLSATVPVDTLVCSEVPPDGFVCEPTGVTRDVAVSAQWMADGPSTRFTERNFSRTETDGMVCVFRQSGRGIRAEAVATATVDGIALGDSQFAMITKGTFRVMDRCR